MLKILGAGLSRTGTHSLAEALTILGYKTLHWAPERLQDIVDGVCQDPDFRRYDDVDAVTDIPAAWFHRELRLAYPGLKIIITIRDPDKWFESVKKHYARIEQPDFALQNLVYGSTTVTKFLYQKRFSDHTDAVLGNSLPGTRLITNVKHGWDPICRFLQLPVPDVPFPHHPG